MIYTTGVKSDYARIRQGNLFVHPDILVTQPSLVLMNLIGNAVKFTAHGHVRVNCSLDTSGPSSSSEEVYLKFVIQYVSCTPVRDIY